MSKGISVLICTYNGEEKLLSTLAHLTAQQNIEAIDWEIIIVDNASTDGTFKRMLEYVNQSSIKDKITLLNEQKPGKLAALKLGISKSKFSYLLICDDDNWLADDYLIKGFNILENNHKVGIIGGNGKPTNSHQIPDWLVPHLHNYAAAPQFPYSTDITETIGSVYGAGMFIRKIIYLKVFDLDWPLFLSCQRVGQNITSGEDTEICYAAKKLGYQILYDESLKFEHDISPNKINQNYLFRLYHLFGYSDAILYPYKADKSFKNKYAIKLILEFYRLIRYNLFRSKSIDTIAYKKAFTFRVGYIKGLLFNYRKINQLKSFLKNFDSSTSHHIQQR